MGGDDKQKRLDASDFANELAGLETGRQDRFFVGAHSATDIDARERRDRDDTTLLQQLLQNPEYARLYRDAWSALGGVQSALDQAINENAQAQERLTQTVEDMENRAATLESGEKVFRSADGNLYTADGRRLSPEEAAGVDVPEDAPSYEAYTQAREALDRARERGRRLADIQTDILDPARRRLEDENDPMTEDELRALEEELKQKTREIEHSSVRPFLEASAPQPAEADEPIITAAALDQIPTFTG